MQAKDLEDAPRNTSLIDLRDPLLDTKREQFLFQLNKDVHLKWHVDTDSTKDNDVIGGVLQSDRPV